MLYLTSSRTALAGAVCNHLGASWALGVDSLSFALSALSLVSIKFRHDGARPGDRAGVFAYLRLGFAFLFRHRVLRALVIFQTAVALLGSIGLGAAVIDLIVYRSRTDFVAGATVVGVSLGFASLGAVRGAVSASRTQRRLTFGAIAVTGTGVQAVGLLATGFGHGVSSVTVGGMLWAGGLTFRAAKASSLRQTQTPDELRGRVVGAGIVTQTAERIGAAYTATCVAVCLAVVTVAGGLSSLTWAISGTGRAADATNGSA